VKLLQLTFRAGSSSHEGLEHGLGLSDAQGGAGSCALVLVRAGLGAGCTGDVSGHFGPFSGQPFEVPSVFEISRGARLVGSLQCFASLVEGVAAGGSGGAAGLGGQDFRCDRSVVLGAGGEGGPGEPSEGDAEGDGGELSVPA
jgi:hypothetical protein